MVSFLKIEMLINWLELGLASSTKPVPTKKISTQKLRYEGTRAGIERAR